MTLCCLCLCLHAVAQNQNISNGIVYDGEPYMVVDPANARHIVVAWMGKPALGQGVAIRTRVTFNGGQSWSAAQSLPHAASTYHSADVSMDYNAAGTLFISYVDYRNNPDSGGVYVLRSTDGGLTWNNMTEAIDGYADGNKIPIDRPWLVVDKSNGANADTLYITTKPAPWILAPNRPYLVKSFDGGNTWQPWRYIDTTAWLVGNFIAAPMAAPDVASDGTLHCVYPSYVASQNILPGYIVASSTNGGASFNYHGVYYAVTNNTDTLPNLGGHLLSDPSNAQHLAFVLPLALLGDLDIYLFESTDGGTTWSVPQRINDDATNNGKMQDLAWADFDNDGDLVIAWRDRRNAAGTGYATPSQIFGAVRWHDSTALAPNFLVSDTMAPYSALYLTGAGNDFMNVRLNNDTMSAVWGDVRSGKLQIWFERKDLKSGTITALQQIVDEPLTRIEVFPNPTTNVVTVQANDLREITLCDENGKMLLQKTCNGNQTTLDIRKLPAGNYLVTVQTMYGSETVKLVKR